MNKMPFFSAACMSIKVALMWQQDLAFADCVRIYKYLLKGELLS